MKSGQKGLRFDMRTEFDQQNTWYQQHRVHDKHDQSMAKVQKRTVHFPVGLADAKHASAAGSHRAESAPISQQSGKSINTSARQPRMEPSTHSVRITGIQCSAQRFCSEDFLNSIGKGFTTLDREMSTNPASLPTESFQAKQEKLSLFSALIDRKRGPGRAD